jgi:16S rRNA (guanine(527)-N(7))-methyltransferase RsmG
MDAPRIAQLLDPFLEARATAASPSPARLTPRRLDQISTYIDLLIRWNARVNLTAIRTPEEIVTRHFGESLFAARHLLPVPDGAAGLSPVVHQAVGGVLIGPEQADTQTMPASTSALDHPGATLPPSDTRQNHSPAPQLFGRPNPTPSLLADLGSGAGFPGLPMKIWSPPTRVTLIESNHKKVAFLREVIRNLTLMDIDVYPGRAEDFPPASVAVLTLRAVERFDAILPIAATLLAPGGRLALLIGQAQVPRAHELAPSLQWSEPIPIPESDSRVLLTGHK